jgi:hypothetical protein
VVVEGAPTLTAGPTFSRAARVAEMSSGVRGE